jgi:chromate transport protein ChrA
MTYAVIAVAVLVVLLTSLFKVVTLSQTVKQVLSVVVSVAAGVLTAWQTGQLANASDVAQTVAVIFGLSQAIYMFLFDAGKPFAAVNDRLEAIGGPKGDGPDGPPGPDAPIVEGEK